MVEITFVGTGDAFGSGGRRNSAILVRADGRTLLLDCGPTTLPGLKALGVDPREIDAIAISHFHGDHSSGVPYLLLDYVFDSKRKTPLIVAGPRGVEKRICELTTAFDYDTNDDRHYSLSYLEFEVDQPIALAGFQVTPMPAHHHPHTSPHMLRVENDERALLFTGDTGWHERLPERAGDVNLMISECVLMDEGFEYHLSHERLMRERERFRCERMILTHLGSEVLEGRDHVQFDTAEDGLRVRL